jgi:PPOX class probable F420-dependent enzyme
MRLLVSGARVGRLATVGAEGQPHLVPVCFALVGDTVYSAVDHKPKRDTRLRRLANVRATGHASVLIDRYAEDWSTLWWVRLDGRGTVIDEPDSVPEARAALIAKYPQYAEHPPTGPVLAVAVTRWTGWAADPANVHG